MESLQIIICLALNVALIIGIYNLCREGHLLYRVVRVFEKPINQFWLIDDLTKPIWRCVYCMSSVWGFMMLYLIRYAFYLDFKIHFMGALFYVIILLGVLFIVSPEEDLEL